RDCAGLLQLVEDRLWSSFLKAFGGLKPIQNEEREISIKADMAFPKMVLGIEGGRKRHEDRPLFWIEIADLRKTRMGASVLEMGQDRGHGLGWLKLPLLAHGSEFVE